MANEPQLNVVNFNKSAYITIEGKTSNNIFYIIRQGTVKVSREALNEIESLKAGDFFGVISAMSNHNNIETSVALTDVSLIEVHRDQFPLLIQKNTQVAMKIILSFSKKLRELDTYMTELSLKSVSSEDIKHLYNIGMYYNNQNQFNQAFYALYRLIQYLPNHEEATKVKEILKNIKDNSKAVYLNPNINDFKRVYPDNTMIFCEHEPGNELYIIQSGKVKITKIIENKEVLIAVLKEGDIFGEMALLENKPRNASAIAYGETYLMSINKDNFNNVMATQPQLITKLISLLAERTWVIYRQLANLKILDKIGRIYDMLLIQLEKNKIQIRPATSYTFEFGPKELINMVGLPSEEGRDVLREIFKNKIFQLVDDKITVSNIEEIQKQVEYYKKMQALEKKRKEKPKTY